MNDNQNDREENIGRAIGWVSWIFFAIKFLVVTTLIALVILYFIKKPLWIAPLISIGAFIIYRLILRLVYKFIEWSGTTS